MLDGAYGDLPRGTGSYDRRAQSLGYQWLGALSRLWLRSPRAFTDAEARHVPGRAGIKDDHVIQVIFSVSGRLPLLLATLAENQPTDPDLVGDPSGDAVERFLKWEPNPVRRTLAIAAALPRFVNEDVWRFCSPPTTAKRQAACSRGCGHCRLSPTTRAAASTTM